MATINIDKLDLDPSNWICNSYQDTTLDTNIYTAKIKYHANIKKFTQKDFNMYTAQQKMMHDSIVRETLENIKKLFVGSYIDVTRFTETENGGIVEFSGFETARSILKRLGVNVKFTTYENRVETFSIVYNYIKIDVEYSESVSPVNLV